MERVILFVKIKQQKQFNNKMNIQNALNFCNQYLMLKILSNPSSDLNKCANLKPSAQGGSKKKAGGKRFENPHKKPHGHQDLLIQVEDPTPEKPKLKKKKFEGGTLKKQTDQTKVSTKKQETNKYDKQTGYVPIENLLNQFISKPEQRNHLDNFKSFGDSRILGNNLNGFQKSINSYEKYSSHNYPTQRWEQTDYKQYTERIYDQPQNISMVKNLHPSQSEYLFESPLRDHQRTPSNFHVPASRSRSRTQLGYSESCSNLSSNSQNKSCNGDSHSITKKKKKGQRQFYLPVSSTIPKQPAQQISRCTSTNHLIAKFQKQILQSHNSANKIQQEEKDKSLISDTRYETKNKTIIKQIEQYSMIQLDNQVRDNLSFVSEINIPQKPICIQMRR